ncbi:hypothetical protein NPIL_360491 [Nephila pilipes]|uniref:Uncharacterized protein n=1 Tax=Nephila pilipes TaxID=299642 RepID=A0A8X6QNP6_NEPPI|nr:hypothetical protein NPIL_360491 [Nephila pilipes]
MVGNLICLTQGNLDQESSRTSTKAKVENWMPKLLRVFYLTLIKDAMDESIYRAIKRSSRWNKEKPPDRLGYLANENKNDPGYYKEIRHCDKNNWLEEDMKSL